MAAQRREWQVWEHLRPRGRTARRPRGAGGGAASEATRQERRADAARSPESPALDRPARRKCHRGVTGGGPICKENLWPNTLRYFLRTSRRDHRPGQCPSLKFTETKATQPNDFGHDEQMEQTLD